MGDGQVASGDMTASVFLRLIFVFFSIVAYLNILKHIHIDFVDVGYMGILPEWKIE